MGRIVMTRFFHRTNSNPMLDDTATQCALAPERKPSFDATSVGSDLTQSERSIPQHLGSEHHCCIDSYCNENVSSMNRRVGFGNVEIRQYEEVVGDHPFCASGCPLQLGWDYVQQKPEPLAEYEESKEHVRQMDELRLTDEQRHSRLLANDVSATEIRRCLRRLHRERECSVRSHLKAKAHFFI